MADYKILVDLDAILDTRIGTLARMDEDVATEIVKSKKYIERLTDRFSSINLLVDDAKYSDLYLKRDERTLAKSLISDVVYTLSLGLQELGGIYDRGIIEGELEVTVNTYPYSLSEDKIKIILDGLGCYLPLHVKVTSVNLSPWHLSSEALSKSYMEWYCYDIEPWLLINTNGLLTNRAPEVKVHLPRISTSGELPERDPLIPCPFKAREMVLREFLDITYNEVSLFSANYEFLTRTKKKMGRPL